VDDVRTANLLGALALADDLRRAAEARRPGEGLPEHE
jgi:hypothetical protein